jgi:hypothetical protein
MKRLFSSSQNTTKERVLELALFLLFVSGIIAAIFIL